MSKEIKKPYVSPKLLKKVNEMAESGVKKPIKTWSRRSTIYPEFVGFTFAVHNGKKTHSSLRDSRHGWSQTW